MQLFLYFVIFNPNSLARVEFPQLTEVETEAPNYSQVTSSMTHSKNMGQDSNLKYSFAGLRTTVPAAVLLSSP